MSKHCVPEFFLSSDISQFAAFFYREIVRDRKLINFEKSFDRFMNFIQNKEGKVCEVHV